MGHGHSNTAVKNNPTTVIKSILKKPSVYPNFYPSTYTSAPINYPGYTVNYRVRFNENDLQTEYYPQTHAKSVVYENPVSHHHHHYRSEHTSQIIPPLLLGSNDSIEESRSTPTLLRENSNSSLFNEYPTSPIVKTSFTVLRQKSLSSAADKRLSPPVFIKQSASFAVHKQRLSPYPVMVRSPPPSISNSVSPRLSITPINSRKSPRVESNRTTQVPDTVINE